MVSCLAVYVLSAVCCLAAVTVQGLPHSPLVDTASTYVESLKRSAEDEPAVEFKAKDSPKTNLKVRFSEESKATVPLSPKSEPDVDDATRSKKSPGIPEMYNPHTTTVCIQVRSNPQDTKVICGPQIDDEKKAPPAARNMYNPYYSRAPGPSQYPPQQYSSPVYPSRNTQQPMRGSSPMNPSAAKGPVYRTDEELIKPDSMPGQGPASGHGQGIPYRGLTPQPNQVLVQKQFYPVPYSPTYSSLRLNCFTQPDPFAPPGMMRSALPASYMGVPLTEQMIALQAPAYGDPAMNMRASMYSPGSQGRPDSGMQYRSPYDMPSSYYDDPYGLDPYAAEYAMAELQARAAQGDGDAQQALWEQQNFNSMAHDSYSSRSSYNDEELHRSRMRLAQLQEQLKEIQSRASMDDMGSKEGSSKTIIIQKDSPAVSSGPSQDQDKKSDPQGPKNSKRQARNMFSMS